MSLQLAWSTFILNGGIGFGIVDRGFGRVKRKSPCSLHEAMLGREDESDGSKRKYKVRERENDALDHDERNRRRARAFEGASVELPPVMLAPHHCPTFSTFSD